MKLIVLFISILQVVVMKCKIHHCKTSGIFMRLAATGVIAGNHCSVI